MNRFFAVQNLLEVDQNGIQTKWKFDKIQTDKMPKNNKIQIGQNKNRTKCKIPKYKHDKIQKNKIQIAKIQM